MSYPYDRDHLDRTRELLYALIPEFHKRRDRAAAVAVPPEPQELYGLLEALAAPLAALRQSVEELYGDLFIETAGEAALPSLAASIGLELVFRDAEANRRDLAAAIGWRRRKGTPAMLEEMGRVLFDRQVALKEGWKAVQMVQDLNILRAERVIADLRPASVADLAAGPLASLMRLFDPRPITADTGHVHPLHLVHWAFPTQFQPLRRAACHELPAGVGDRRFAFDAANDWRPLRVRATGFADRPGSDRVPEGLFAEAPGNWFGAEGRFQVRLTGVPAAATRPAAPVPRNPVRVRADNALGRGPATVALIDAQTRRYSGPIEIALVSAPQAGGLPDLSQSVLRGRVSVGPAGASGAATGAGNVPVDHVMLLRLTPEAGAASRMLGETVIAISGTTANGRRRATDPALAQAGYLRGALYLRIPEQRIHGARHLWIAADGSLHEAEAPGAVPPLRPLEGGALPARALVSAPVGPVWPEAPETALRTPFAPALAAPAAAPAILHGGEILRANASGVISSGARSALVLALSFFAGQRRFMPMLRLTWQGPDPRAATWAALGANGAPITAASLRARFAELAETVSANPSDLALALRYECGVAGAIMTPCELAFTAYDSSSVLINLPEMVASETAEAAPDGSAFWPRGPAPLVRHSVAVQAGSDGSSWIAGTTTLARKSLGPAAPLLAARPMRRREAGWRRLCPWRNETAADVLEPTQPARLDIDPRFGLFALNLADEIVPHPKATGIPVPDPVTVDLEEGATMPIGALPIDHRRHLGLRPAPTRLVSALGHLGRDALPGLVGLPLHRSVAAALAAAAGSGLPDEVIEIVDSGLYRAEALIWPAGPRQLELRAAPFQRPVLQIASSTPGAGGYGALVLSGFAIDSGALDLDLPSAQQVSLTFLSVYGAEARLRLRLFEATGAERVSIRRCALGPVSVEDAGEIAVLDSILAAGNDTSFALSAPAARLDAERATFAGRVEVGEVELSDCIVTGRLDAHERFRGCLRYSLVGPGSLTPRRHRVLETDPVTGRPIRVPFESRDRRDPAWLRLEPQGDPRILAGASDGGEMGAFGAARLGELYGGLARRLSEHTPAGLRSGIVTRP